MSNRLEERLVFGSYPEVVTTINREEREDLLEEITKSYLYKDVLDLANIKYPNKIKDLLKLLAFQIGSEVSISELSNALDINSETIANYIDLLEKSFVVFRLSGFNRNLRKEVSKMDKIFFWDLGIRNAIIDNFKPLKDRNDIGQLWENFLIVERSKYLAYNKIHASQYFWRVYTGAEIDYVEEREGQLRAYEFKYKNQKNGRIPQSWKETYKESSFDFITTENYLDFLI